MTRRPTISAILAAFALAGAGLVAATAQAAPDAADDAASKVRLKDGQVVMPATVRAGLHTFVVRGRGSLQLVKARGKYTPEEFASDYNAGVTGGEVEALTRLEEHVSFLGGASVSKSTAPVKAQLVLPRGTFWAVDTSRALSPESVAVAKAGGRAVRGDTTGTAQIRAIDPNRWDPEPETLAETGSLEFINTSTDNHFVALQRLLPGKTISDYSDWVRAVNANPATAGPPPVDRDAPGLTSAVVGPGGSLSTSYSLPAGDYVLTCYWPDAAMDGMKHAFMGMFRAITVTPGA